MDLPLEAQIAALLLQKEFTLALAESCTGGLVSHRVTNIPGSSAYYLGGVTAYSLEAKQHLLGVRRETLEQYGAVSEKTVREMARGARAVFSADVGVSVSGIAGPDGGTPEKPVGLVWIGLSAPGGEWAWRYLWHGNREQNKASSADAVLKRLLDYLTGK